jgi:hypothetical protein
VKDQLTKRFEDISLISGARTRGGTRGISFCTRSIHLNFHSWVSWKEA